MKKIINYRQYKSLGKFKLNEVLDFIPFDKNLKKIKDLKRSKMYNGISVKLTSLRYIVFKHKGTKCVKCGIEGEYFSLDYKDTKEKNKCYHFNLYAIDKNNREILMTKDHIYPKSKGGSDDLSNLQTMCCVCNSNKGNKIEEEENDERIS